MKKELKRDIIYILFLIGSFFVIYFAITRFGLIYGSTKDWLQQHSVIPEYFRNLFYKNHDLFPDFAFNLGSGQNIYSFSYYGYLSPIILLSYLLPFVPMPTYIIISSIVVLMVSVIMMYFFIKKKTNSEIALICSFVFLMSTPLIFHSHRHIMFMNYFPFLLLGYIGCEKYFANKNYYLLTLAVFLMIMTSYFFSICGIVSIVIYGIYCYIKVKDKITFKSFICDGLKFIVPILIAVMMSCILLGPTAYALLNGRVANESINLLSYLKPDIILSHMLYYSYSLGLPVIALFSLIYNFFDDHRENIFLAITLSIILIFPIFCYLLNATLYVNYKSLIPLLPLFIILLSSCLKDLQKNDKKIKKISMMTIIVCSLSFFLSDQKYENIIIIDLIILLICLFVNTKRHDLKAFYLLFPFLIVLSIKFNLEDVLVYRGYDDGANVDEIDEILSDDQSFYRIGIYDKSLTNTNVVYDMEYYGTMIYSSSQSGAYDDFYYNRIGNEIICRSARQELDTSNLFFNMYLGNKYIVSKDFDSLFYDEKDKNIYYNDNVLPVGYVTNRLMSLKRYETLSYPDSVYAYLNYTIVDDDSIVDDYVSPFEKIDLDYEILDSDVKYKYIDDELQIKSSANDSKARIKINDDLQDEVLIISFDMDYQEKCRVGDTSISINGVVNKLTCSSWKYNNKNYEFKYVLANRDLKYLDIRFSKGKFKISNIKFYTIDREKIDDITNGLDHFNIDRSKTRGDEIYGDIDVSKAGYFNLSIPYDEGFTISLDGKKVDYERVDVDFIGFEVDEIGHHDMRIEYRSPFKGISIIISIFGLILFVGEIFMVGILQLCGSFISEMKDPKTRLFKVAIGTYKKYKEIFNYLVVGALTTVVSLASKWILLFTVLDAKDAFQLQLAVIISWICAVIFAYFTNRIFVFYSQNKNILKEMIKFFGARVLTLVMEMVIMWFFVTLLKLNTDTWVMIWTIITQVLIMIFNYIFSKLIVFKKNK